MKVAGSIYCAVDVYRTTGSADLTGLTGLTGLTPVGSNVDDKESSPYVAFPAGPTRIILTCAGRPDYLVLDSGTHTLSAGFVRMPGSPRCSGAA